MNRYEGDGDQQRGNSHRLYTGILVVFRIDDDHIGNQFSGCGRCNSAYENESEQQNEETDRGASRVSESADIFSRLRNIPVVAEVVVTDVAEVDVLDVVVVERNVGMAERPVVVERVFPVVVATD
jgi:hypothetical protein